MTRLQSIDVEDWTGGLNLKATQFSLGDNESPAMLNVDVDARGGFRTRLGWERWNADDVVGDPSNWSPRNAFATRLSTGAIAVYVANGSEVYAAAGAGQFAPLGVTVGATPHLADFESWGDTTYIVGGEPNLSIRREGTNPAATIDDASFGYNDDYTIPTRGRFPVARHIAAHSGYIFVAGVEEQGLIEPNRIRWSHPNEPEDWATDDFLDIDIGGGRITGLMSFQDHLLIFKTDSVWALYGYDLNSWQLIQVSRAIGLPTCAAVTRSEDAVYMYSASGRNGVYQYRDGSILLLSEVLDPVMEQVVAPNDIWVGWVGRRLWVTVPWAGDLGPDPFPGNSPTVSTTFVWDPTLGGGRGAWLAYRSALGSFRQAIEGTDTLTDWPLGTLDGDSGHAVLVRLDRTPQAADVIIDQATLTPFVASYRTRWYTAGRPTVRKSWRRPRAVIPIPVQNITLRLDAYKDYNETDPSRTFRLEVGSDGGVFWRAGGFDDPAPGGFDFKALGADDPSGRGANFGSAPQGSVLERNVAGLGVSRALQLKFSTYAEIDPGVAWGVDGLFLKFVMRRHTT